MNKRVFWIVNPIIIIIVDPSHDLRSNTSSDLEGLLRRSCYKHKRKCFSCVFETSGGRKSKWSPKPRHRIPQVPKESLRSSWDSSSPPLSLPETRGFGEVSSAR